MNRHALIGLNRRSVSVRMPLLVNACRGKNPILIYSLSNPEIADRERITLIVNKYLNENNFLKKISSKRMECGADIPFFIRCWGIHVLPGEHLHMERSGRSWWLPSV